MGDEKEKIRMKTIAIRCTGTKSIPIEEMKRFQGKLKYLPDENFKRLEISILKNGFRLPIMMWENNILDGHSRLAVLEHLKTEGYDIPKIPVVELQADSEKDARKLLLLINSRYGIISEQGFFEFAQEFDMSDLQFEINIPELRLNGEGGEAAAAGSSDEAKAKLQDKFIIPPFSIFDTRQGYWRDRNALWMSLGIKSELGRGENLLKFSKTAQLKKKDYSAALLYKNRQVQDFDHYRKKEKGEASAYKGQAGLNKIMAQKKESGPVAAMKRINAKSKQANNEKFYGKFNKGVPEDVKNKFGAYETNGNVIDGDGHLTGTSIFSPVLCELIYKWFNVPAGSVLDPFAGGSVRGITAGFLGYDYTGIELSETQIEHNNHQVGQILSIGKPVKGQKTISKPAALTPVEFKDKLLGGIWLKRDDLFEVAGVRGGKVRTCLHLAQKAKGIVSAGSRKSPQINIVANIAKHLGIPARCHSPEGELGDDLIFAQNAGCQIIQHKAGYNNVIIKRAEDDAKKQGFTYIPFGMECPEAVEMTARQVENIPDDVKRIVVPLGSGMSLCGILTGLQRFKKDIPVLAVQVGADPLKRLKEFAPAGWEKMLKIVKSKHDYHAEIDAELDGIVLDPIYEAKCVEHLQPGDLLWIVGIRQSKQKSVKLPRWIHGSSEQVEKHCKGEAFDLVFSCPPYHNLEVYSDDPRDLSTMGWEDFKRKYAEIIRKSCDLLKGDRFACFVVSEIRDEKGIYKDFVSYTIDCFKRAGLTFYNDIILVNSIGTLPVRIQKQWRFRKIGRCHQNVLIFYKGNPKKIPDNYSNLGINNLEELLKLHNKEPAAEKPAEEGKA